MLRPGLLLALSLTGTFVDALLRTDFAVRRHPSYPDVLALSGTLFSKARQRAPLGAQCTFGPYSPNSAPEIME